MYYQQWRLANLDHVRDYQRGYYQQNRDRIRELNRERCRRYRQRKAAEAADDVAVAAEDGGILAVLSDSDSASASAESGEQAKQCRECGEFKPLGAFYASPQNLDGHRGRCAQCCNPAPPRWRPLVQVPWVPAEAPGPPPPRHSYLTPVEAAIARFALANPDAPVLEQADQGELKRITTFMQDWEALRAAQ